MLCVPKFFGGGFFTRSVSETKNHKTQTQEACKLSSVLSSVMEPLEKPVC